MALPLGYAIPINKKDWFLYNLVTNYRFWSKPSLSDFISRLQSMLKHAESNGVKTVSVPRMGEGLDTFNFKQTVTAFRRVLVPLCNSCQIQHNSG